MPLISENYAKNNKEQISFLFKKSASWIFGLSFPLFLIIIMFSKQILTLFYGVEYAAGYIPLVIVATGFIINIATGLNIQILTLHKKTRFIFYVNVVIAFSNIILNILLIPVWGIVGAAVSSAFAMAIQNIIFLSLATNNL